MSALEDRVKEAILSFRRGEISLNALAVISSPLIRRCSASAAYHVRLDASHDIASGVWIALQRKGFEQWDESNSIGAYISRIANNLSIMMVRENALYASPATNDKGENVETVEESEDSISSGNDDELETKISKKLSIDAIRQKMLYASRADENLTEDEKLAKQKNLMPGVSVGKITAARLPANSIKQKNTSRGYSLSEDQQELVNILEIMRKKKSMTQSDFAEKLGIKGPRLASYLYGRTSGVPLHILEAARELAKSDGKSPGKFDDKEMPEILAEWSRDLQLKRTSDAKLADVLDVSVSTVCRWRTKETKKPGLNELASLASKIEREVNKIKRKTEKAAVTKE